MILFYKLHESTITQPVLFSMRLYFSLSPSLIPVGYDYPYALSKVFHRWLGMSNPWHDTLSLYSLGWLTDARTTTEGLSFPYGSKWFVSGWEAELLQQLLTGLVRNTDVLAGMRIEEIRIAEPPSFREKQVFRLSGPVLLKAPQEDGSTRFLTYSDPEANDALTRSVQRKMDTAGVGHLTSEIKLRFLSDYQGAKTKLVRIKNIQNRASFCPIEAEGSPEALRFVWLTGVGHSTGVGFGGIN